MKISKTNYGVVICVLVLVAFAQMTGISDDALISDVIAPHSPVVSTNAPVLTTQRQRHILYGDSSGGGHHHSANKPCKSEFPEDWTEKEIINVVKKLAANDNAPWRQEDNGYHVAEQNHDRLRIRIVLDEDRRRIITAYPTNVARNPCDRGRDQ